MKTLTNISILVLTILSSSAFAKTKMPAEVTFESTEKPEIERRVIRFVRTQIGSENSPVTYEGGFTGLDFQINPTTGRLEEIPFPLDDAGTGDCWLTTPELWGKGQISKIQCDNDAYAEGGSTGVIAAFQEDTQSFHITGYVKNRPNARENWTKAFGTKFKIKNIIWD